MRAIPILLLAGAVACSGDPTGSNTTPIAAATISADVATVAADAAAEDIDLMAGMSGLPGTISFAAALLPPDGPPGPGNVNGCGFGGGRFSCPRNRANGLDVDRVVAFFDGSGAAQQAYDAATTARIEIDVTLSGDVTRGPWSASIMRHRELVITGLEGTETTRTINGTGEEEHSRSRHGESGGPTRQYDLEGTVTWNNVVIPVRAEGQAPWPLSGTTTRVITVTRSTESGPVTTTRTVIITFDGTVSPPATVNGEPFTINLAQRRAQRR